MRTMIYTYISYISYIIYTQRIRGFGDNALYKSTFYLLTYLLSNDDTFNDLD